MAKYKVLRRLSYEPKEPDLRFRWQIWEIGEILDSALLPTVIPIEILVNDGALKKI